MTLSFVTVGPALLWSTGSQSGQGAAFLFLLAAIPAAARAFYLALRHRSYRRSLSLSLVLLSFSGLLALIAWMTPGPIPVKRTAATYCAGSRAKDAVCGKMTADPPQLAVIFPKPHISGTTGTSEGAARSNRQMRLFVTSTWKLVISVISFRSGVQQDHRSSTAVCEPPPCYAKVGS